MSAAPVLARARCITSSRARPLRLAAKRARLSAYMPGGSQGLTGRSTCGGGRGAAGHAQWQTAARGVAVRLAISSPPTAGMLSESGRPSQGLQAGAVTLN